MMNRFNPMQMIQAFDRFRQNFLGDPQQTVMQLVQSGRMTQGQLNQLQNMATEFRRMMNGN